MLVEGTAVPAHVLEAEERAKDHAVPHVNFYDPSAYEVRPPACFELISLILRYPSRISHFGDPPAPCSKHECIDVLSYPTSCSLCLVSITPRNKCRKRCWPCA